MSFRALRQRGFGIMELLVVLGIMAILAAISVPVYRSYTSNAQATEIVLLYDALRSGLAAEFDQGETANCADVLGAVGATSRDQALSDHFARVSIAFNAVGGVGTNGYSPAMLVCGRQDAQGNLGRAVAESTFEELSALNRVLPGATVTDSMVVFSAPLGDPNVPLCRIPVGGTVDGCGQPVAVPTMPTVAVPTQVTQPAPVAPPQIQIAVPKLRAPVMQFAGPDVFLRPAGSGRLDTGGDLDQMSLDMSFIGDGSIPAASGGQGPVMFNYGDSSNGHNAISLWNPRSLTVALAGTDYDTGINVVDGQTHRVTVSWDSATGALDIYDNGQLVQSFSDVARNQKLAGNGFMVVAHKGEPGQYSSGEAFAGQIFHTSFARTAVTAQQAANPLDRVLDTGSGLLLDVRSQGSSIVETTGRQAIETGGVQSVMSDVDGNLVQ